jgi:[ribosomal protein S5]-alanine N-acetyltransferase
MNWQPGALLTLQTERLELRSMCREDVSETFTDWLADPQVMLGLNMPQRRMSRAQAVRWVLEFDNRNRFFLGIHVRPNGPLIGFFTVQCETQTRCAETAVVVGDKAWWGKNVVLEARTALLDFLFDDMQLHKVLGRPHGRNFASIFNYKAMGFRCEAVLREQLLAIQDQSRLDQLVFGILRSEWQARKAQREVVPA